MKTTLKIYEWQALDAPEKKRIMERAMVDIASIRDYVAGWMETIKAEGDAGIVKYTRQFDDKKFKLSNLRVTPEDIAKAYKRVDPRVVEVLKRQIGIARQNAL